MLIISILVKVLHNIIGVVPPSLPSKLKAKGGLGLKNISIHRWFEVELVVEFEYSFQSKALIAINFPCKEEVG